MAYSWEGHPSGKKVWFIDTPGFNDTETSDTDLLIRLVEFLESTYRANIKLAGITYPHRITDNRMEGSKLTILDLFKALCGNDCLPRVVLATTHWNDFQRPDLERFEEELETTYWKDMIEYNGRAFRQENLDTAREIINHIINLAKAGGIILQVQKQRVDQQMPVSETSAGHTLNSELLTLQDACRKKPQPVKDKLRSSECRHKRSYESQISEYREKMPEACRRPANIFIRISAFGRLRSRCARRSIAIELDVGACQYGCGSCRYGLQR
ncbi:hypothetical protein AFLA70_442g000910 [Aspergillus flavus AF70]|nr:hypothetical protein AFLA70_442g000910 [Aspergillus flavus AF70]